MARPTKYNKSILEKANEYLDNFNTEHKHKIPSVAGLGKILKITRETLYQWAKDEDKTEFSDTLSQIMSDQEFELVNGGLDGALNPTIAKLMLHNHGHHDKQDTNIKAAVLDLTDLEDDELDRKLKQLENQHEQSTKD